MNSPLPVFILPHLVLYFCSWHPLRPPPKCYFHWKVFSLPLWKPHTPSFCWLIVVFQSEKSRNVRMAHCIFVKTLGCRNLCVVIVQRQNRGSQSGAATPLLSTQWLCRKLSHKCLHLPLSCLMSELGLQVD